MASVVLVSKGGIEFSVSSVTAFVNAVYASGAMPKTGSVRDNYEHLQSAAPPPTGSPNQNVTLAQLQDLLSAKANRPVSDSDLPARLSEMSLRGAFETAAGEIVPPLVATAIAADDTVAQSVAAAVDTEVDARNLLTASAAATSFAPAVESLLLARQRAAKGGVIGVGPGKGAVAIRFDDWHAAFKANVYAALTARGLPFGFASISRLTTQPWTTGVNTADIVAWNRNGGEIHSHGIDHKDPSPFGDAGLVEQIVTSKAEIEAWGVKCQGWMQPGATPLGTDVPYGTDFTTFDSLNTRAGQLIRQTHPQSESYASGIVRNIPHGAYHGLDHVTVSDGMTLAVAKTWVDTAARDGLGVELMCHSGNLGGVGNMTVADFIALLDYIVGAWNAGTIDVLTPSGLMFADRSSNRLDLFRDGGFEAMTTGVTPPNWSGVWTGKTIETSGGRTGSRFLRIDNATTSLLSFRTSNMLTRGLAGETWLFEGWARSNGAGSTVSRALVTDYDDTSRLNLSLTRTGIGTAWTRVRHAFSTSPLTDRLSVAIGRNSGDGIDWDDVHVLKV